MVPFDVVFAGCRESAAYVWFAHMLCFEWLSRGLSLVLGYKSNATIGNRKFKWNWNCRKEMLGCYFKKICELCKKKSNNNLNGNNVLGEDL